MVTQHFPEWIAASGDSFFEAWALVCSLHDLATTAQHRNDAHMSFELHGGLVALQVLQRLRAPKAQAECREGDHPRPASW